MKNWIRLIALLLLLAMCLSALMACNNEPSLESPDDPTISQDPSTENDPTTPEGEIPPEEEEQPILLDPAQAMILVENAKTEYVIVRDDAASSNVVSQVNAFRSRFQAKTGADIRMNKDTSKETPKEIIISMMDGRTQPAQEYAKLTVPEGKGYRISVVGESIVVASEAEYLAEALDLLTMAICDCGNGIWGVPKGYEGEMDIPAFPKSGKLYQVSEGNYTYDVQFVVNTQVNSFMSAMEADGFTNYSEHSIGESKFVTYIKDSIYGQMVVHTMYHPNLRRFRMTFGPMEYLPNVEQPTGETLVDPTITQMYLEMMSKTGTLTLTNGQVSKIDQAPGMSYLIQLSDGRFVVIDGGGADGNFQKVTQTADGKWVADNSTSSGDAKRLYNTMVSMKPAEHAKPQIAMWLISHPHADHYDLANKFLSDYTNKIELEMVAFNVPAPNELKDANEQKMNTFKERAQDLYGADVWTMHTGQKLLLPGATVEVLSTVEDLYCEGNKSLFGDDVINNTCAVVRIYVGDMSFMVLADAYETTSTFMVEAYGNALQSDIMQVSHHGYNGATLKLYQLIDPKICLWPTDEFRYQTAPQVLGTASGFQFNYWLRNNRWTRANGSTGARDHYTASFVTTINTKTEKITKKI